MTLILPEVHASGKWKLKDPFTNYLSKDVWYTCIAIRRLDDYIKRGIDPYEEFYKKSYSIEETRYKEDLSAGHCIIVVKNAAGEIKSFPSSYLESFPSAGGVPYQALALAIDLGAIPVSMDLTLLMTQVENLVKDHVGKTSTARLINLAPKELIDGDSSKRIEAERQRTIKVQFSPTAKLRRMEEDNKILRKQLVEAENYIIAMTKKN